MKMRPVSVSYGCITNTVHLKSIKQKIFIIEYKSLFQLNGSSVSDESVHVSEVSSTLGQQFCGHRLCSVPYLGSWFMTVWSSILLSARTMRIFPYGLSV